MLASLVSPGTFDTVHNHVSRVESIEQPHPLVVAQVLLIFPLR